MLKTTIFFRDMVNVYIDSLDKSSWSKQVKFK